MMDIKVIVDPICSDDGEHFYIGSRLTRIVGREYYTGVCSYRDGKVILSLAGIWLDAIGAAAASMLEDTGSPPAVLKIVEFPFTQSFVTTVVHESMHSLMMGEAARGTHHWALEKIGFL